MSLDVAHAFRVAGQVKGDGDAWLVGLLHDVLEDTDLDADVLIDSGVPSHVVEAVVALTKGHDEPYAGYIERVRANELARRVKLADLQDNLAHTDEREKALRLRYESALRKLSEATTSTGAAPGWKRGSPRSDRRPPG
jgi:(p)ppGpp synthase/HD superfamily hydrolase